MHILLILLSIIAALFILYRFILIPYLKLYIVKHDPPEVYPLATIENNLNQNVYSHRFQNQLNHYFILMHQQLTGSKNYHSTDLAESLHQLEADLQSKTSKNCALLIFKPGQTLNQWFDKPVFHNIFVQALRESTLVMTQDHDTYFAVIEK